MNELIGYAIMHEDGTLYATIFDTPAEAANMSIKLKDYFGKKRKTVKIYTHDETFE